MELQKHALKYRIKNAKTNDLLLLAEIQSQGPAVVCYGMWLKCQRPAERGETDKIWGKEWKFIIEGQGCDSLPRFSPEREKVSLKNYGKGGGGTVIYVLPEDMNAFREKGLLMPFMS
ncbi:MAG: hypothetical protein WBP94_20360 [Rhodomicrobiaceae bacterium]